jgi:hydroxyacylglutathione hydrolase
MPLTIEQFLIGSDNYAVLLHDMQTGRTAAIDAMDAAPIKAVLDAHKWHLTDILVTHKHVDHVSGIADLKAHYGCKVYGPSKSSTEIGNLDVLLHEGDHISFGTQTIQVWETPGHSSDHVSFILPQRNVAFLGDTLFPLGCGRIFDSDAVRFYHSLSRIACLPDETKLYCGHEYTLSNLKFALTLEPNNIALQKRKIIIEAMRADHMPTVLTTIAQEKATNPYLRLNSQEILQNLNMVGAKPVDVFTEIRRRKDNF